MEYTRFLIPGVALSVLFATAGCDWMHKKDPPQEKGENALRLEREARLRRACASELTYDRLKEYAFDEAQRIRGGDGRALDAIATGSLLRMEEPVVKARDEALNVTVCSGEMVLDLPPGVENAFDGERRLRAEVEYSAQAAVDGSGLVYAMRGAEPIIYRLATLNGGGPALAAVAPEAPAPEPASPGPSSAEPPAAEAGRPAPAPPAARTETARPSFNCRHARTRTERMVCANPGLAAQDRQMAALYYARMADSGPDIRARLRRSRDAFLRERERCASTGCVATVYAARVEEIERMTSGR